MADLSLFWGPLLCLGTALAHFFLSWYTTHFIAKRFQQISSQDIRYAANWIVSLLQATLTTLLGVVLCSYTGFDLLVVRLPILIPIGWTMLGYWIYDIIALFCIATDDTTDDNCNKTSKDSSLCSIMNLHTRIAVFVRWWPGMVFHHLGIILLIFFGILGSTRNGKGDGMIVLGFVMEFSSIFVAARSALAKLKLKSTRVYLFVSIKMVITFFLVRIAFMPLGIYLYGAQTNIGPIEAFFSIPIKCQVGTGLFYSLNMYWFMLMIRGCIKASVKSKR